MPRNDDGYDDRPKKSWREIDKSRDGKRSSSGPRPEQSDRSPRDQAATYSRYKSAADAFFSGESVPEALKEKVDPTGEGAARKNALSALKSAEDFKDFATKSKDYVERYGLPEDPYLLDRMLGHPNEALVLKTLERLTEMLKAGELKPPKSLNERLKSLELGSDDPDVQDGAKALALALRNAPR